MKKSNRIHEVINLLSDGLEDEFGINHDIEIKEAHRLSMDYCHMWGVELSLHDQVFMHYGNTKPGRELTREEWKEAYRDYRKYCRYCNNDYYFS